MSFSQAPSLDSSATPDEVCAALEEHGCIVIERLIGEATVAKLMAELGPHLEAEGTGVGDITGYRTKRVSRMLAKAPTYGELALNPLILSVVDRIFGDRCQHFQIGVTQAISIGPGEAAQALHRDDAVYPFTHPGPECIVNMTWAMCDFTEENGATQAIVGSHRWPDERTPGDDDVVARAVMPRGSVFLYLGSTYHGGGANRAERWRTGLLLGYSLGWLRQEENQYLAIPREVVMKMPETLQRLIGYTLHPPYLGHYELQDPKILLEDDASRRTTKDLLQAGVSNIAQAKDAVLTALPTGNCGGDGIKDRPIE